MTKQHGFTIIELMTAMAIVLFATMAAAAVMVAGVSMSHNAEMLSDDEDTARGAGQDLLKAVHAAGLYTPGGIWVYGGGSQPTLINPVWGIDGATSGTKTDQLFVVVPDVNALRDGCVAGNPGGGVPLISPSGTTSTVQVNCLAAALPNFNSGDMYVISNLTTGALLTGTTFATGGGKVTLNATNMAQYSDTGPAGTGTGYLFGDIAFRVQVWRFFIATDPLSNRPALMKHLQATSNTAAVFVDDGTTSDELVEPFVEDLQVVFQLDSTNSGNPTSYTLSTNGDLSPAYAPGLRSARISVAAVSKSTDKTAKGSADTRLSQMTIENHVGAAAADGYRRSLYVERVELPNLAPGNL